MSTTIIRILVFSTAAIYLVFSVWYTVRCRDDEHKKHVRQKTALLMEKTTAVSIVFTVIGYLFYPNMNAIYPILIYALFSIYTHIIGSLYFHFKAEISNIQISQ